MYTDDFSQYRLKKIATIKTRMETLRLTPEELAEKTLLDLDLILDIINGKIRYLDEAVYDTLAEVLHWEKHSTYFGRAKKLERTFEIGAKYRISEKKKKDSWELTYKEKKGAHHIFYDKEYGWQMTFTDAQLIGKTVEKIAD